MITFAREAAPDAEVLNGRAYAALWEAALLESGLPVATSETGRPRFALAALLPGGVGGRAELAETWLMERLAAWRVREALEPAVPSGHELRSLEDTWLGAPPLPARVSAADYEVVLRQGPPGEVLAAAATRLLAAPAILRQRAKGTGTKTFDLRRLLIDIRVGDWDGAAASGRLRIRTRIHPEIGSGRPDDVLAALADDLGAELIAESVVRHRLLLGDELDS
jgi:hypothetical protein